MKKKKVIFIATSIMITILLLGCEKQTEDQTVNLMIEKATEQIQDTEVLAKETPLAATQPPEEPVLIETPLEEPQKIEVEDSVTEPETLGNPRSSYGLGSAAFLKGRNVLVSLFVTTPESGWSEKEQEEALAQIEKAVSYIEEQADIYGIETELVYNFKEEQSLKVEAQTDFCINEEVDFIDRLDEEIACWMEEKISYEELKNRYDAEGIATMIFVNNPGVSYAIVYDGTDSQKETIILFTGDFYQKGKAETATAYAHEILHVFGAHDLYQDAEFTKEVTDYVAVTYPNEIMYTVAEPQSGKISSTLSPITAYHLGWILETEEVQLFPQLERE